MQENGYKPNESDKQSTKNYAKYTGIVFQMIAIIGVFAFIGLQLDTHFKNSPQWITAIACILGVVLSLYLTIKQLSK